MVRRGVALGVTSQLSSSFPSINMSGLKWGGGSNALLLGTNVAGSIVAWGLMLVTLLENPLGSELFSVCPGSLLPCKLIKVHAYIMCKQRWGFLQVAMILNVV